MNFPGFADEDCNPFPHSHGPTRSSSIHTIFITCQIILSNLHVRSRRCPAGCCVLELHRCNWFSQKLVLTYWNLVTYSRSQLGSGKIAAAI